MFLKIIMTLVFGILSFNVVMAQELDFLGSWSGKASIIEHKNGAVISKRNCDYSKVEFTREQSQTEELSVDTTVRCEGLDGVSEELYFSPRYKILGNDLWKYDVKMGSIGPKAFSAKDRLCRCVSSNCSDATQWQNWKWECKYWDYMENNLNSNGSLSLKINYPKFGEDEFSEDAIYQTLEITLKRN